MPLTRHWPAVVAGAAILLSLVLWIRLERLSDRLDETQDVTARLAIQAAVVDGVISSLSGPLRAQLDTVVGELDDFATSVLSFPIDIDQDLPIDTEISFSRTLQVPINATIPIDETLDTTITVLGPLGVDVDVDVSVPINVDVPVDIVVPIEIDEVIPVRTTVPVTLSFPIELEVAGTPLADLAIALRDGLGDLAGAFG